jgi:demethylmenaquinone methyltransferase/2-methoxy-6-polyprenyl-1,4-benzoquinol methylase
VSDIQDEQVWESQIQALFARIAGRYDLMNRLMTLGQDRRWRRQVLHLAQIPTGGWLLDLGAGTGDLARAASHDKPASHVVASDFTMEMMRAGKGQAGSSAILWCSANALHLPYPQDSFDAVVSGFLLRNVSDACACLAEQRRVLKAGGWLVALDTTLPRPGVFTPSVHFHLQRVIPALGRWIARDGRAYTYLSDSTEHFLSAEKLSFLLINAGFRQVSFRRMMFATIAIHRGMK